MLELSELMKEARAAGASDLILVTGRSAGVYVHGRLGPLNEHVLTAAELDQALMAALNTEQQRLLARSGDVNFSHSVSGVGRARINIHRQRGTLAAAVRFIQTSVPTFADLRLPGVLGDIARLPRGLVLVTGATGSGKSTTLAAMIEFINEHFEKHVITLEDPIEYLFSHRRCSIEQRQIGEDSPTFGDALRHVVRQKPDVILVGEMRDRETIATALTAAETGHLVLATLHTNSAAQAVERVIDVFEASQQSQIRVQLAATLQAVICQALLPLRDGSGMVPALEMLTMNPAVRRCIRESEVHLIPGIIETGQKFGMVTMDRSLADLVNRGVVLPEAALDKATDVERMGKMLGSDAAGESARPTDPVPRRPRPAGTVAPAAVARPVPVVPAPTKVEPAAPAVSRPWY